MLWGIQNGGLRLPHGFAGRSLLGYETHRHAAAPPGGADSLKTRFSPNASTGDVYITSVGTSGGYRKQLRQDGTYWWAANGDESPQLIQADLYSLTFSSLNGEGTLAVNIAPPRPTSGSLLGGASVQIGQPISLPLQGIDPQNFTITYTLQSGSLPPGLALTGAVVSGTPTAYGTYGFAIRLTDSFGAFSDSVEQLTVQGSLPNFVGELLAVAQAQIAALGISETHSVVASSAPANTVLTQSSPPQTPINSTSFTVALQISNAALSTPNPDLFPAALLGITFDSTRSVEWATDSQRAVTGKVSTLQKAKYPTIHWDLVFEVLNQSAALDELRQIVALFNRKQAQAGTFYYLDPVFNTVVNEPFGTGDASTKQFQLVASYSNSGGPGAKEIIQKLQAAPALFDNGSLISTSAYSINNYGVVTFTTAPASGHALTWAGGFYYIAQFETDDLEPSEFMAQLWEIKSLKLKSVVI